MATYEMSCTDGMVGSEALATRLDGFPRLNVRAILSESRGWTLPIGYSDPGSKWSDEAKAYDGDTGTYAYQDLSVAIRDYLELLLLDPLWCDKIRIYAARYHSPSLYDPLVGIDLYYSNAWHHVFFGVIPKQTWVEIPLTIGEKITRQWVSRARVVFYYEKISPGDQGRLYELEFAGQVTPRVQLSAVNTIADGITLSEELLISWKYLLTATDGLELSDAAVTKLEYFLTALDGLDLSDTPVVIKILELLAADGVVHSDSTLAGVAGRLLKILTYALAYRDLNVYTRPYYDQKVYTADVSEVEE